MEQLREAVAILAETAEGQISYLREMGHFGAASIPNNQINIDEIALQFEDASYAIHSLVESGEISKESEDYLLRLSDQLIRLSGKGNRKFWTLNSLRADPRWAEIRTLARSCLDHISS